jgi:hypothetical protein
MTASAPGDSVKTTPDPVDAGAVTPLALSLGQLGHARLPAHAAERSGYKAAAAAMEAAAAAAAATRHEEPKVMVPFVSRAGVTPREVQVRA